MASENTKRDKVRENRLRRMADRYGFRLVKSRRRDPRSNDYGLYALLDIETGGSIFAHSPWGIFNQTLDEIEEYLTSDK